MTRCGTVDIKGACGGKFPGHFTGVTASVLCVQADYDIDSVTYPDKIPMTGDVPKGIALDVALRRARYGTRLTESAGAASTPDGASYSEIEILTPSIITRIWGALKTTTYRGLTNIDLIAE